MTSEMERIQSIQENDHESSQASANMSLDSKDSEHNKSDADDLDLANDHKLSSANMGPFVEAIGQPDFQYSSSFNAG